MFTQAGTKSTVLEVFDEHELANVSLVFSHFIVPWTLWTRLQGGWEHGQPYFIESRPLSFCANSCSGGRTYAHFRDELGVGQSAGGGLIAPTMVVLPKMTAASSPVTLLVRTYEIF